MSVRCIRPINYPMDPTDFFFGGGVLSLTVTVLETVEYKINFY